MNKKKLLSQLYRKVEQTLTDEELLTGPAYLEYASSVADGMTEKYGQNTRVIVYKNDKPDAESACTSGREVLINAWCDFYKNIQNLTERHWCVLGRIVHECGHILWTNFKAMVKAQESIVDEHKLYPAPDENQDELKDFLDKNPGMAAPISKIWFSIFNCTEDGFIEKLLLVKFPGYGTYLKRNREMVQAGLPTYTDQKAQGLQDIVILTNLILNYAKYGRVENFDPADMQDEVVTTFIKVRPLIDAVVDERSSYFRQKKVNSLFLAIFKIIKDEAERQMQQGNGQGDPQQSGGQSGRQNGQSSQGSDSEQSNNGSEQENESAGQEETGEESGSEEGSEQSEQEGNSSEEGEQSEGNGSEQGGSQSGQGGNNPAQGNGQPTEEEIAQAIESLLNAAAAAAGEASENGSTEHDLSEGPLDDESESSSVEQLSPASSGSEGSAGSGSNPQTKGGEINEPKSDALEAVKKKAAQKKVDENVEQAITSVINVEVDEIAHDPGIHNGVPHRVYRVDAAEGENGYNQNHQYLDILARRMMKNLLKEIRDRKLGDALDGNYFGNRLDTNQLYRRDKKLYIRDVLPENVPDMEIMMVIDCSGSMCGQKIDVAKKAAYTVWKFCQMVGIPVSVIGHDTDYSTVKIYSVADGNSIDGNDGKRIFALEGGGCNRDGFAVRYAIKKLQKSQADDRILLVISDGCPNHGDYKSYGGSEARADIQDAVAKAKKDDIYVITAGIGESAESIKRIWTEGVSPKRAAKFLDLTDMEKLPKVFVKLIKSQLELAA